MSSRIRRAPPRAPSRQRRCSSPSSASSNQVRLSTTNGCAECDPRAWRRQGGRTMVANEQAREARRVAGALVVGLGRLELGAVVDPRATAQVTRPRPRVLAALLLGLAAACLGCSACDNCTYQEDAHPRLYATSGQLVVALLRRVVLNLMAPTATSAGAARRTAPYRGRTSPRRSSRCCSAPRRPTLPACDGQAFLPSARAGTPANLNQARPRRHVTVQKTYGNHGRPRT